MTNFEITAKTFNGDSYKLQGLSSTSTVGQLLEKVKEKYSNVNKESITLVYNGLPILDQHTPANYAKTL